MTQDIRILGVKNWRSVALNGEEWRTILRKARAHKGLSCQWWWWWWYDAKINNISNLSYYLLMISPVAFGDYCSLNTSQSSSVGTVTGYRINGRGIWGLIPGRGKRFFCTASTPALEPTQPPNQRVPTALSKGDKAAGAWSWPLTSNSCRDQENVDVYIHSHIRLHGVVLN
jgi:hypothetical protein